MDAKLNQSDLTALLAKLCEISVSKADTFTKAFFDVIIEGLERDGIVKINGLGTFKMVDVASRSSVNVNNGEKFEIKGHKKISFLPADSLKEKVNAPFAMFEPVEVDDDYVDDEETSSEETADAVGQKNTVDAVVQEVSGDTQPDGLAVEAAEQETVAEEQLDSGNSTESAGEEDIRNAQPAGDAVENVGQQAAVEDGIETVAVATEKEAGDNDLYKQHLNEAMNNYETLTTSFKLVQAELKSLGF
ncbi:MAG: HU family DNA-binding protein [Bacteroidaceae bacterium]|nr:HU family DNA-binding protein [Bacteroidaceae bacterium]